ncbi:MAG: tetratricopeptide repeat protein [Anaerolineae bacterium]|nr:tetratricopeptide repeat protein [Anaerolineae bacterium]
MSDKIQKLKEKIDATNELAWVLKSNDVKQARTLLEEALQLSTTGEFKESPYHEGFIRNLIGLGYIHRITGDLNEAMNYLTEARQLSEATGLLQSMVFVNLGSVFSLLGDLLQSLQAYEKGLAAARQIADSHYAAEALIGIANVHAMHTDFSEAIEYVKQSLELSKETQNLRGQLHALNNLAAIYQLAGDYENAQITIEEALSLIDNGHFVFEKIFVISTAGEIQFSLGNYQQALANFQRALSLSESTSILEPKPGILVNISKVYKDQEEIELEIEVLHQAIKVSEALQHFDAQHVCHQRLAVIYESQGDFETALEHHKQFHVIKEKLFNEAADQKLRSLQVLYETETHKQQAEIARLKNIELAQAKEAVETANRVKSIFLANMSHELRTPLNAILGIVQLMQYDSSLSPTNNENLRIIVRSGEHLLDLINDVLDLSKIEADKMSVYLSLFDCYQLFDELEAMFSLRVQQKHLVFNIHCAPNVPQWIKADERKLRQVLLNLVGNAVKFTNDGHIDLRINYANDRLYFEVGDTGRGIAQEEVKRLFTPFHQSPRQEAIEEGTGLGLAISQAYVRLMGDGSIAVTSELNRGSRFRFDIPIEVGLPHNRVDSVLFKRVKALKAGQPISRILIADDHADGRIALVRLLRSIGFDVQEAVDGQQAVDVSRAWQPDLIFMDIRMPEMDGYEATRRIKHFNPQIVIIAITSNGFKDEKVNEVGFDDFLLKPLKNDLIFETIAQYLDVKYIYDEIQISKSEPILGDDKIFELLHAQPLLWQQKLHHHAVAGNKNKVLKLVEELHSQHNELADAIRTLVKDYKFERLITLTEVKLI